MVTCHFLYYLVCQQSPSIVQIYSDLPAVWLSYCRGERSQKEMTAAAWAPGADPAPISSSSHFYTTALNQIGREEERASERQGEESDTVVILRMEMATLKEALENGPSPSAAPSQAGASKERRAAPAKDTNDPMTPGRAAGALTSLYTTHPM